MMVKSLVMLQSAAKFNENDACFITLQTVDSVDIFVRPVHKQVIVHTLNHFIDSKGLRVYAWCLMTHHLHLLIEGMPPADLEKLEREFKLFTTSKILEAIDTEPEERKEWMMKRLECSGSILGLMKKYEVWGKSAHRCFDIKKDDIILEQFDFIHQNPVRDRIVDAPAEYLYSSARDYTGTRGLVNIIKLPSIELQLAAAETMSGNFFVKYIRN
jgi:putative transposase